MWLLDTAPGRFPGPAPPRRVCCFLFQVGFPLLSLYLEETDHADSQTPSTPSPDDMHWGLSFLREDLHVKQEMRGFRQDMADQIGSVRQDMTDQMGGARKEAAEQTSSVRKDMADQFKDVRSEIRHSMIISMGYTTILLGLLSVPAVPVAAGLTTPRGRTRIRPIVWQTMGATRSRLQSTTGRNLT